MDAAASSSSQGSDSSSCCDEHQHRAPASSALQAYLHQNSIGSASSEDDMSIQEDRGGSTQHFLARQGSPAVSPDEEPLMHQLQGDLCHTKEIVCAAMVRERESPSEGAASVLTGRAIVRWVGSLPRTDAERHEHRKRDQSPCDKGSVRAEGAPSHSRPTRCALECASLLGPQTFLWYAACS